MSDLHAPDCAAVDCRPAGLTVSGRLSITTENLAPDAQPAYSSGSFTWAEQGDASSLAFATPLGQIVAELWIEPGRARMRSSAGDEVAVSPDELAARRLGAPLPVEGLRDWLRGRDRSGRPRAPAAFDEDGWSIAYPRMSADGTHPAALRLRRAGPPAIDVRIVIDDWTGVAP
ncbi:outer membrane lipoprotein LolB [Derxia lacustris]|uniref:outer membrane lipoprotein LolB n=1 Tax=Derxia lacustris TaxID=764842 RepID=UPI00159337B9|nr:outer membrane lipoprotein LolB [Derxia lacustris]